MKLLREILYEVEIISIIGEIPLSFNKIEFDSRLVNPEDVYIAIDGVNVDGHNYIQKAIELGAKTIVCEKLPQEIILKILSY